MPTVLEWGQVLVSVQLAAVSPADLYTPRLGGVYGGDEAPERPFVCGHDGVGVVHTVRQAGKDGGALNGAIATRGRRRPGSPAQVCLWIAPPPGHCSRPRMQVGPGVKQLVEGDVVLLTRPFAGSWRSRFVCPGKELLRVGGMPPATDPPALPLEYLAVSRELMTAYRLLEQHAELKARWWRRG